MSDDFILKMAQQLSPEFEPEPCPDFAPRPVEPTDYTDCGSTGHYLCAYCAHRKKCFCGQPTAFFSDKCEKCNNVLYALFD